MLQKTSPTFCALVATLMLLSLGISQSAQSEYRKMGLQEEGEAVDDYEHMPGEICNAKFFSCSDLQGRLLNWGRGKGEQAPEAMTKFHVNEEQGRQKGQNDTAVSWDLASMPFFSMRQGSGFTAPESGRRGVVCSPCVMLSS